MSNDLSVNTRTGKITGVIRLLNDLTDAQINAFAMLCHSITGDYYYIIHDKDVNDDGSIKTKHLHFVIESSNRKHLSTWLNLIADALGLENANGIEIQKTVSFVGSVQYLTHQNYKDKHPYDPHLIKTNVNDDQLSTILNMSRSGLDIDYLIYVIDTSITLIDVMRSLGLTYYHLYRATINDIWKLRKSVQS